MNKTEWIGRKIKMARQGILVTFKSIKHDTFMKDVPSLVRIIFESFLKTGQTIYKPNMTKYYNRTHS